MEFTDFVQAVAGRWAGEETLYVPGEDGKWAGSGVLTCWPVLGGRALSLDYAHYQGERLTLRSQSTLYDTGSGLCLHWLTDHVGDARLYTGAMDETGVCLTRQDEAGQTHEIAYALDKGEIAYRSRVTAGGTPRPTVEACYSKAPVRGRIGWLDLTVDQAAAVRDFYAAVVGWTAEEVPMGAYADFLMRDAAGTEVAGICHRRGVNAGLPTAWLAYLTVADLPAALDRAEAGGGRIVERRERMAVVLDPAGAHFALYQE